MTKITPAEYAKSLTQKKTHDPYLEELTEEFLENVTIERVVKLAEGMGIRGIFRGRGADIEIAERGDDSAKIVATWRLEMKDGNIARLMSSYQLYAAFEKMPEGMMVRVAKVGTIETRAGRRCSDYIIAVEKSEINGVALPEASTVVTNATDTEQ